MKTTSKYILCYLVFVIETVLTMMYELGQTGQSTIKTYQSSTINRKSPNLRHIDIYGALIMIYCRYVAKIRRNNSVLLSI